MPLGQFLVETVGQLVAQATMEIGGEAIHGKFGWKGCLFTIVLVNSAIAGLILLVTS